jgi:hypothetical protein
VQPIIEHGTVGAKIHAEVESTVYSAAHVVQTVAEAHMRQLAMIVQGEHRVVASP